MDGWIIGNILLGGLVGVAIDAARGAGQKFPPQVTVVLEPARYESAAARDAWYASRRAEIEENWGRAITEVRSRYRGPQAGNECDEPVRKLERKWDEQLEELEARLAKGRAGP